MKEFSEMTYQPKQIKCYALMVFLAFPFWSWGQTAMSSSEQQEQFVLAKNYLMGFKNDSALLVLDKLVENLAQAKELNSSFGLKVQFRQAEALEKDQRDSIAMVKLLHVKDLSFEKEVWDVYANSNLILARLYEKIGLDNSCLVHLRLADSAIKSHVELDSIYPLYCIRISSYHRIFDNVDSSKYYAKEVLRTAPKYNQLEETAVGHMLMGMLEKGDTDERLNHWKAAAKNFLIVKDYTGYSYMTGSARGWYLSKGSLDRALAYNDTTLAIAKKIKGGGNDEHFVLSNAYHFRSKVYKQKGDIDSAMYYMDKGYRNQLDHNWQENNEKVLAVDARYKDEKKALKIAEQARELKFEKERKYWWLGLTALMLLFTGALGHNV